ncbi:MAG: sirohydrochlorin cobaltochelatase [Oligoflexia bacterium]|nr:sirohydrochlorin cobaltochelatase [Oligoflexia bacterium]
MSMRGILLVTFGSSYPQTQRAYDLIESETKKYLKDNSKECEVRWAYSSKILREKINKTTRRRIDSPEEALKKFIDEKFDEITVQSLHVIAGHEFNALRDMILKNSKYFNELSLGLPLISSISDIDLVNKYLLASLKEERRRDDAVIFFAHGTDHYGGLAYTAIQNQLSKLDECAFVATVEGEDKENYFNILRDCKRRGVRRAYLVPYMSVVGDHIINDMAGEDDESLKSILERENIESIPILRGLAEDKDIVGVWMKHLMDAKKI